MHMRTAGMLVFALGLAPRAQPLDLHGRVVRENGAPIPDALVELKTGRASTTTAADGSFSLDGNTSAGPDAVRSFAYRLEPDFLVVDARHPLDIRMEVVDGAGRAQGGLVRRLQEGRSRIALSEALPAPDPDAGLYFLRVGVGGRTFVHLLFHPGKGATGAVIGPAYPGGGAAKRSEAVDSLRIRKAGYEDLVLAIASYTAGNLGDLVLSADPEGGGVCARQRTGRTSDGFEVVFCEALFDQPPRVHLPVAAAPYAYAGMASNAFVTVAGESYPHASSGPSDPEISRHASALYEIGIRNGKVESFRPAIVFAESLFMAPLMGKAFDGFISKRTDAAHYELKPSLPIRMQILAERFQGGLKSPSAFPVRTAIVNLAAPVRAADGTCMPALSSYGPEAPFDPGSDILVPVGRHPSMHAFGDDETVFHLVKAGKEAGSVMSVEWFFTPLDLARNTLAPSGTYTGVGHGTPGAIPMLELNAVSGGGGACSPE
jgi:hypothetical protein